MTYTKTDPDATEFGLRYQIEQLKLEAGALRMALIFVLQTGLTDKSRDRANKALGGSYE